MLDHWISCKTAHQARKKYQRGQVLQLVVVCTAGGGAWTRWTGLRESQLCNEERLRFCILP